MRPGLDRLPGPLGQQITGDQTAHGLLQGIVVALVPGPVVLFPGRGGQRVQHPPDYLGTFRSEVAVQHAGAAERGRQLQAAVIEVAVRVLGPPNDMPWGQRVAHILDPDGNTVNLTEPLL